MTDFANGDPAFYGLADASRDVDLGLLLHSAAAAGPRVRSETQPWSATSILLG